MGTKVNNYSIDGYIPSILQRPRTPALGIAHMIRAR